MVLRERKTVTLGLGLILLIWLARLLVIDHFPPFLDEGLHVYFAERSVLVSPLVYGSQGRLFTIWWYILFQPQHAATFWIVRTATVLGILPGAAGFIAIGRLKAGVWGATLAGLVYLFSTYHQFYDTLALSDTLAAGASLFAVYTAYRLSRRVSMVDALLIGAAVFVAVGAKVSALVFFAVPVAAALTLWSKGRGWREQARWLAVALVSGLALTAFYAIVLRVFGYDLLTLIGAHNPNMGAQLLPRLISNAGKTLAVVQGYVGLPMFVFLTVSLVILVIKRDFYFLLCLIVPLVALWAGQEQSSRFFDASVAIFLLCGVIALIHIADWLKENRATGDVWKWAVVILVVIWGALQWIPFTGEMMSKPAQLALPQADFDEYVYSDASGFGLRETETDLQPLHPREVIGLLSNCQGLRYLALADFSVTCPPINPNGQEIPALTQLLESKRSVGDTYVVLEDSPYVPHDIPGTLLTVVQRPANGPTLSVYRLDPPGA